MDGDALVRDYLGRLEAASWPLDPGRRIELRAEVAEHIEVALAEAGARDEVAVRNVLERLGPPEEIASADADAATEPSRPMTSPNTAGSVWGPMEILAIAILTLGSILLPGIGPLIGLVFVWGSRAWTPREKLTASVIVVVFFVTPILGVAGARMGS